MTEFDSLQDRFLIAMPGHSEGYFDHSVTYICEHNEHGALGLVINRPMEATVQDMLAELDLASSDAKADRDTDHDSDNATDNKPATDQAPLGSDVRTKSLLTGGPVQPERGFVLHSSAEDIDPEQSKIWQSSLPVSSKVSLTGSLDVLSAIANGKGPSQYLVAMGYAGWEAGQLEQELADSVWLIGRGNNKILFDLPYEERWMAAARSLGIDPSMLSADIGHA